MVEFYLDEHPKDSGDGSGGSWGDGGGGSGSGGGSGGGGSGGGGGSWGSGGSGGGSGSGLDPGGGILPPEELWHLVGSWRMDLSLILCDGSGMILRFGAYLLMGENSCLELEIYAQIEGDDSGTHCRCILLKTELRKSVSPELFPSLPNAIGIISAKWQAGHYDYAVIHHVRFKILNTVTAYYRLSMTEYRPIATIAIHNGQITIDQIPGV